MRQVLRAAGMLRGMPIRVRGKALRLQAFAPTSTLVLDEHFVFSSKYLAIDAHNHLGRWLTGGTRWAVPDVDAYLETMARLNVIAVVNLDGRWGDELQDNLDRYDRSHPGKFLTFCHVDWRLLRRPGASRRMVASLVSSAAAGAAGLKVWKDLGLKLRDGTGKLVLPDDPRLSDVWDTAGELGLPVLIHCGDPVAFFRPANRHNERIEELAAHPDWSIRPRQPTFERLQEAQEALLAGHPKTKFIGAHVGGWPENLARVSELLNRYANFSIDMSQRIAELGRQPRAAAGFFRRHSERILFGTDLQLGRLSEIYAYYRLLETDDEHFPYSSLPIPPQGRWTVSGLNLPDSVLQLVYAHNAKRLLPDVVASSKVSPPFVPASTAMQGERLGPSR